MKPWKLFLAPLCIAATSARADFAEPRRVNEVGGQATQTATGIDVANNAYIASVIGERIVIRVIGPDLDVAVPMEGSGAGQGDPDFATTPGGKTFLSFSQQADGAGEGREILLTWNGSAGFLEPHNVSNNRVDDSAPKLVLDDLGRPHIVWAQRIQEETRVMYWRDSSPGESPVEAAPVAVGDYPAIFVDSAGDVHLVYSRENDLYYNRSTGGVFSGERLVTGTPSDPESSAGIGGDSFGNIVICYESRRALYYATLAPGESLRSRLIDTGGVQDPRMRVRSQGQISIAYLKDGDIYHVTGIPAFLNQPEAIVVSPGVVESSPSIEIDLSGNLHLSFIREGEVYYTTNAASPTAEFSADPTLGEVPLEVRFADLSNGDIQVWEWDFGDGGRSTEPHPEHTYTAPGKYTVSLRVVGPGAVESTEVKTDFIFVQTASNTLRVPNQKAYPGQRDVWFPFIANHKEPVDAVTIMATYDPTILVFKELTLAGTVLGSLNPDFIHIRNGDVFIEAAVIIDLYEPIEDIHLPPGQNQTVWHAIFDVAEDAPVGAVTQLDLVNNRALSDVFNMFTINGLSEFPLLTSSSVRIVERGESGVFLRGDTDGNSTLDITDAVRILNYLFLGGSPPICEDASDVLDTGSVDISAAIALLNYLFLGGMTPAVPFPVAGLDPSDDALTPCP
jgi:PKD repeat protein